MPPQSNFGEVPRRIQRGKKGVLADGASNDVAFGDTEIKPLEELTTNELFLRRKAHQIHLKLGYRDAAIDIMVIDEIRDVMKARGVSEDEYLTFLKTSLDSEEEMHPHIPS